MLRGASCIAILLSLAASAFGQTKEMECSLGPNKVSVKVSFDAGQHALSVDGDASHFDRYSDWSVQYISEDQMLVVGLADADAIDQPWVSPVRVVQISFAQPSLVFEDFGRRWLRDPIVSESPDRFVCNRTN